MSAAKIIEIAKGEVGYLEKKSNSNLYEKTANAGSNNYTKYGAWYGGGSLQGQPWCDMFVSWCAEQAGEAAAVGCYAYVPSHQNFFDNKGQYFARGAKTPQAGDIIIFKNESHIGIVEYVKNGYVHTIEGNTSGGSTLVANGGGVFQKSYSLSSSYIQGYGRPTYSTTTTTTTTTVNYTGTVTVKTSLNCRSTPSTSGSIVTTYQNGDKVTITKECDGWGYTGKGWVSLEYITKDTTASTTEATTTKKYTVGWHQDSKGKWYADTETTYYKSQWAKINDKWYEFDKEGYMMANTWTTANNEHYYLGEDGTATTNYIVGLDSEGRLRPIEPYYHLISELPDYYRTECDKLIEAGKLNGKEGEGDNLVLDLPLSAIRAIIIANR